MQQATVREMIDEAELYEALSGKRTGEMALQSIIDILEEKPCRNILNR